jgi:anti-sigma B factor antagonist
MSSCACVPQPQFSAAFLKEPKLNLNLEVRESSDVTVVYCKGRIVYRDEAAAFSGKIFDVLSRTRQLVLDLSGVQIMDSAGLGELVAVLHQANESGSTVRLAAPSKLVHGLLKLTNLDSLFEIHSTVGEAMHFSEQSALAQASC